MTTENEIRTQLAAIEARLSRLTQAVDRVTGERDFLLLQLTDNEGSSRQIVGAVGAGIYCHLTAKSADNGGQ